MIENHLTDRTLICEPLFKYLIIHINLHLELKTLSIILCLYTSDFFGLNKSVFMAWKSYFYLYDRTFNCRSGWEYYPEGVSSRFIQFKRQFFYKDQIVILFKMRCKYFSREFSYFKVDMDSLDPATWDLHWWSIAYTSVASSNWRAQGVRKVVCSVYGRPPKAILMNFQWVQGRQEFVSPQGTGMDYKIVIRDWIPVSLLDVSIQAQSFS